MGQRRMQSCLFVLIIIFNPYFQLDLIEGWRCSRYEGSSSFVKKL